MQKNYECGKYFLNELDQQSLCLEATLYRFERLMEGHYWFSSFKPVCRDSWKICQFLLLISFVKSRFKPHTHRLNMELDLRSLFGFHVYGCTNWPRPHTFRPPPTFGLLVSKNRRYLFVTPLRTLFENQLIHRVGRVLSVSPVVGIGTPPPL
jgi:hypothetical protein